jgi:hypothetical protein
MPPRSLATLAHALAAAPDLEGALVALGDTLAELERGAALALVRYDARRSMLRERLVPVGPQVERSALETIMDHLPEGIQSQLAAGSPFVDLTDRTADYARLFGFRQFLDGGVLALQGLRVEGLLDAVLALYEPRKIFGTRTTERLGPAVALFDLAYSRIAERDARVEAVRTLEDVTQRVHGEYVRKLATLETALREREAAPAVAPQTDVSGQWQAEAAREAEEARRMLRRAEVADQQLTAAVGQLEQVHLELHRRSESLRQQQRTLDLMDRALSLDAGTRDSRQLVDGLLTMLGDDMETQRCSLMLRAPDPDHLYLAAARGVSGGVVEGRLIRIGEGVAGRVAATREPLLVQDVREATQHPLLHDQYFTTGSFMSLPLVYRGDLVGVLNLTNKAQRGSYTAADVERVRVLAMLLALIITRHDLPARLYEALHGP